MLTLARLCLCRGGAGRPHPPRGGGKAEGGDDSIYNFYLVEGPVNRYLKDGLNLQHKRAWVGELGWRISRAHTKIICDAGRLALGSKGPAQVM